MEGFIECLVVYHVAMVLMGSAKCLSIVSMVVMGKIPWTFGTLE